MDPIAVIRIQHEALAKGMQAIATIDDEDVRIRLIRWRRQTCSAELVNFVCVDGQTRFRCEKRPHKTGPHERRTPPVEARWTVAGTNQFVDYLITHPVTP